MRSVVTAVMVIGDLVLYQGRRYKLRGIDPMSVPDRRAELEDPETGERVRVPLGEIEPADAPSDPDDAVVLRKRGLS